MLQAIQNMFTEEIGVIAQALVCIVLAIHVFSRATKICELERNRRVIRAIINFFKLVSKKFIEANTHIRKPSNQRKIIALWL